MRRLHAAAIALAVCSLSPALADKLGNTEHKAPMKPMATGSAMMGTRDDSAAKDSEAIEALAHQFIDAIDKGDTKTAYADCGAPMQIIDEFPPHAWQGMNACEAWGNDFDAYNKKNKVTDPVATIGEAYHIDISSDRAYAVFPASYKYKMAGKPVNEAGAKFTVALQKTAAGWRMTGWAWTRR